MSPRMKRSKTMSQRAAAIGALLAFGFAANSGSTPQPAESADAIKISNFAFEPSTLTVSAGTMLSWVNDDDDPHTVIGTDPDSPIK